MRQSAVLRAALTACRSTSASAQRHTQRYPQCASVVAALPQDVAPCFVTAGLVNERDFFPATALCRNRALMSPPAAVVWVARLGAHAQSVDPHARPRTVNESCFSVAPTANIIAHLKNAIKEQKTSALKHIDADHLTIYTPDPNGDVEVVLPSGARTKYRKETEPDAALPANTEATPYLFELPRPLGEGPCQWFIAAVDSGDFADAIEYLKELMKPYTTRDPDCCHPRRVPFTWKEEEWQTSLKRARGGLKGLRGDASARMERICGFHNATGMGKTHSLLSAAKLLGAQVGLYIAYNLGQQLALDFNRPATTVLYRVLLASMGVGNKATNRLLLVNNTLVTIDQDRLLECVVHHLASSVPSRTASKHLDSTDIFIGVDEIRKLIPDDRQQTNERVMNVMSILGELAHRLHTEGVSCTVVVSSLTQETFQATSARPVLAVTQPEAEASVVDNFVDALFPTATPRQRAMIAACAGTHLRSLVLACEELKERHEAEVDVAWLLNCIKDGLKTWLSPFESCAIKGYVKSRVTLNHEDSLRAFPLAAPFVDTSGAVAPAYLCCTFKDDAAKLLTEFFSAKQLEQSGAAYDRFRALHNLPVVPPSLTVQNRGGRAPNWFTDLRFDAALAKNDTDGKSLFRVARGSVEPTGHVPTEDAYCFPDASNHPWIDRAALVYHQATYERCLVIVQDKIRSEQFPHAADELNRAADALTEVMKAKNMNATVLCVAQVIGASPDVTKQIEFRHPYLLICDEDLTKYYTPSFVPAIRFLQQRHQVSYPAAARDVVPKKL